jgi:hypothetical protein
MQKEILFIIVFIIVIIIFAIAYKKGYGQTYGIIPGILRLREAEKEAAANKNIAYEGNIKTGGGCEVDSSGKKIVTGNGNDLAKIKSHYAQTYKSGIMVHLNYTTWCPCCTGFIPTWDKFTKNAAPNIKTAKIDLGKVRVPGINKVPTVVVYNAETGKIQIITGPSDIEEIEKAIKLVSKEV